VEKCKILVKIVPVAAKEALFDKILEIA